MVRIHLQYAEIEQCDQACWEIVRVLQYPPWGFPLSPEPADDWQSSITLFKRLLLTGRCSS